MGGEAGSAGSGPSCDPTMSPDEATCVIDEEYGVFASPSGHDDTGNGSRTKPYATLSKAITKASASNKRVYACADAGAYTESVSIGAGSGGIEMFGGFSCIGWSYSTSLRSRVTSPDSLALHIDSVTSAHIEDFRFTAADGATPGESSVGVFVANSTGVVIGRTMITAGKGVDGADGTLEAFTYDDQSALDGNNANGMAAGAEKVCLCGGGMQTSGGLGGTASIGGGQTGGNGTPSLGGGKGGTPGPCSPNGTGQDGASAAATTPGQGAMTPGVLQSSGWTPASGDDGSTGGPGQGGGGGASSAVAGGGGGACGSCGGAGGPGGQGGGASIALLVYQSEVTVEDSKLASSNGGKGGNGAAGQAAQAEAGLAGGGTLAVTCPGGNGGLGADGAAGGGGAGGMSIGILWKGNAAPSESGVTITIGTPGAKGVGGEPTVNDGIDGVAQERFHAS
jgi:hypothetical protein